VAKRTIADLDPARKRVLLRADLNVPIEHGRVADDTRIRATLPTVRALLDGGAMVGICSHLGRPKGPDDALSLSPVAERLSELLGHRVSLAADCVGNEVAEEVRGTPFGQALLLENVRFHPEEERNDPAFAKALAAPFDVVRERRLRRGASCARFARGGSRTSCRRTPACFSRPRSACSPVSSPRPSARSLRSSAARR